MAVNATLKRKNIDGSFTIIHPKTHTDQVENLSTLLSALVIEKLSDIGDVILTAPTADQVLTYSAGNWINKTPADYLLKTGGIMSNNILFDNYGKGIVGIYNSSRFQTVFAMGALYTMKSNGVDLLNDANNDSFYGIGWTHSYNTDANARKITGHHAIFVSAGVTKSAIGDHIWTGGNIYGYNLYENGTAISSKYWQAMGTWKPESLNAMTRVIGITAESHASNFGLATLDGAMYAYVDGFFYQNEGAYRVLDTNTGLALTGGTLTNTLTFSTAGVDNLRLHLNATLGGDWGIRPFISGISNGGLSLYNYVDSTTPFVIQAATDNVGIGTTDPKQKLDLYGNISLGSWTKPGNTYIGLRRNDNGAFGTGGDSGLAIESYNNAAPYEGNYSQKIHLRTHLYNGGTHDALTAMGDRVGIGTTAPEERLSVAGNINLTTGENRYLSIGSGSNYYYNLRAIGDDFSIECPTYGSRLYIDYSSGGNVGINTVSPQLKFHVEGGHGDARMAVWASNPNGDSDAAKSARMVIWASEPGISYNGGGIGNNITTRPYNTNTGVIDINYGASWMRFIRDSVYVGIRRTDNTVLEKTLMDSNGDSHLGNIYAGSIVQAGNFYINNANTKLSEGGTDSLRITTPYGYVDIGPMNTGQAHIQTNMPDFYFNKSISVDGNIGMYDTNTYMQKSTGFIFENGVRVLTADSNLAAAKLTGDINTARLPYASDTQKGAVKVKVVGTVMTIYTS